MKRFRLLGFYVVGIVAVIGLAVWGVAMKRTAAEAGTPSAPEAAPIAPATANTEPSPAAAGAWHGPQLTSEAIVPDDGFQPRPRRWNKPEVRRVKFVGTLAS